ncbi:hypothetical protein LJ737_19905 [Hymenobacter sp. 15J16-1T3B]|uniref:hypothetical protein n=1 Tax=Hymenobacter sp. 15J16-1T3B TaxID=2886941 RepID=UPI001D114B12|nr:hypothetical protein [Hymenobacter sp. 15J16-1T3B]MCC3159517.1 hypothetical protein [Hymenobacter sp. 15J16-1T3B]
MAKPKPKKPSKADLAHARTVMRALGVGQLHGTGDGAYFTTREAAADYAGPTDTLILYTLA